MSDSNLSKNDLADICRSLGISTEGNKTELVQRIKEYPRYEDYRENGEVLGNLDTTRQDVVDLDSVASGYHSEASNISDKDLQTLRELARKSTERAKVTSLKTGSHDEELQGEPKIQPNKPAKRKLHESEDSLEEKLLLGFKKLENSMLNFDSKLNTVTLQVQETRQKAEIKDAWPKHKFDKARDQHEYNTLRSVGKELDLAMESLTADDITNHLDVAKEQIESRMFTLRVAEGFGWEIASALPDTQDDWLKGKDSLIEKAKAIVDVKRNKRHKTYDMGKSPSYLQRRNVNQLSYYNKHQSDFRNKFFRPNYQFQNSATPLQNKCYICGGYGHFARTCASDPNKTSDQQQYQRYGYKSRGYSAYRNKYENRARDDAKYE